MKSLFKVHFAFTDSILEFISSETKYFHRKQARKLNESYLLTQKYLMGKRIFYSFFLFEFMLGESELTFPYNLKKDPRLFLVIFKFDKTIKTDTSLKKVLSEKGVFQ